MGGKTERCWNPRCQRPGWIEDHCGWRWCFRHWLWQWRWAGCGLAWRIQQLRYYRLRWPWRAVWH